MKTEMFDQSLWADPQFSREYRENADHFILQREELFRILRSFYRAFVARPTPRQVCDLGCGDGVVTHQLFLEDPSINPTIIDGSAEMLKAAEKRLEALPQVTYVLFPFSSILQTALPEGPYDLVASAFALHHLVLEQKQTMFERILENLSPGGHFLNIDTVLPDDPSFTHWYYACWQEWVDERDARLRLGGTFKNIADKARQNPDNNLSPLAPQLQALTQAGFVNVECHYKNGLFCVYSGTCAGG